MWQINLSISGCQLSHHSCSSFTHSFLWIYPLAWATWKQHWGSCLHPSSNVNSVKQFSKRWLSGTRWAGRPKYKKVLGGSLRESRDVHRHQVVLYTMKGLITQYLDCAHSVYLYFHWEALLSLINHCKTVINHDGVFWCSSWCYLIWKYA